MSKKVLHGLGTDISEQLSYVDGIHAWCKLGNITSYPSEKLWSIKDHYCWILWLQRLAARGGSSFRRGWTYCVIVRYSNIDRDERAYDQKTQTLKQLVLHWNLDHDTENTAKIEHWGILGKNLGEDATMLAEFKIIHWVHGFFTGHFFFFPYIPECRVSLGRRGLIQSESTSMPEHVSIVWGIFSNSSWHVLFSRQMREYPLYDFNLDTFPWS